MRVLIIRLFILLGLFLPALASAVTPMVAAGGEHTVALKADGTLVAWGKNGDGQLGDGTTTQRHSQVAVPGLTGVVDVAAGWAHTVALKSDGTVVTWGNNGGGQLGDGSATTRLSPVAVPGLTGVVAVAAGIWHTVALKSDGTVVAWGYNLEGELGDGTTTDRLSPVAVSGLTGVVAVSSSKGGFHSVALKSDGTMRAWGYNLSGQLGDGTTTQRLSPVSVLGFPPITTSIITEFPVPTSPFGITAGPDGNLWFAEETANKIARMTTAGVVTEFAIPTPNSAPQRIVSGPGYLLFVEGIGNKIGMITTSGVFTELDNTPGGWPQCLAIGPDGNLWFTDQGPMGGGAASGDGSIGRVTPFGVLTKFPLLTHDTQAEYITVGPDGALWFTQSSNKIGRITTAGAVTEFAIPTPDSGPGLIVTGSDGALWFTENAASKIGRVTTSGVFTEYALPADTNPAGIVAGPDGALWFTEPGILTGPNLDIWSGGGQKIGRITTDGVITEYAIPTANSRPGMITVGPDKALWFGESDGNNKIGRLAIPFLSYSAESGYGTAGVSPATGTPSTTLTYKVVYTHAANTAPSAIQVCIDAAPCNTMSVDASATAALHDGDYANGEQYVYTTMLAAGSHTYFFVASDGVTAIGLPASGDLSGPIVVVAGTNTAPSFAIGDGKVTTDFNADADTGNSVTVQADDKILVAGRKWNGSNLDFALARYNTDGALDTSFDADGKVTTDFGTNSNGQGYGVTLQSDGKILVAGSSQNDSFDFALARYNADGSLDTSFDGDGKATTNFNTSLLSSDDYGQSVAVQTDGKILVAGKSSLEAGRDSDFALARFNTDGSLDTSFGVDGKLTTNFNSYDDSGNSVTVQSDGKILVAGYAAVNGVSLRGADFAIARYNTDGSLDTSFDGDGKVTTAFGGTGMFGGTEMGNSVTVQADGKILVAEFSFSGGGGNKDFALARYNPDGSLDARFNLSSTLNNSPTYTAGGAAVVLDSDVQIYDAQLAASGNFGGASLTLARNGGANAQDVFSNTGTLGALTQGGNLTVGGITIGTVTTNSNGTLTLTFNSSATQSRVNSAMRQIAYRNSSNSPPTSAQINWTFNDGNSGAQGSGGALNVVGSTTVSIITPVVLPLPGGETTEVTPPPGETFIAQPKVSATVPTVSGVSFPHGTIAYAVISPIGGSVTTTFKFTPALAPTTVLYKMAANGTATLIPGSMWTRTDTGTSTTIALTLHDGGLFDLDGLANGQIVDPVAIGVAQVVDLVPTVVSTASASVAVGGSFTITDTVKNQGTTAGTYNNLVARRYLSADATITGADIWIGDRMFNALAAGASSSGAATVTVPGNLAPGTYYIGVIEDSFNGQPENNETNNARAGAAITIHPKKLC
jgi:uncharacterized delta-60 repeat protein